MGLKVKRIMFGVGLGLVVSALVYNLIYFKVITNVVGGGFLMGLGIGVIISPFLARLVDKAVR